MEGSRRFHPNPLQESCLYGSRSGRDCNLSSEVVDGIETLCNRLTVILNGGQVSRHVHPDYNGTDVHIIGQRLPLLLEFLVMETSLPADVPG